MKDQVSPQQSLSLPPDLEGEQEDYLLEIWKHLLEDLMLFFLKAPHYFPSPASSQRL